MRRYILLCVIIIVSMAAILSACDSSKSGKNNKSPVKAEDNTDESISLDTKSTDMGDAMTSSFESNLPGTKSTDKEDTIISSLLTVDDYLNILKIKFPSIVRDLEIAETNNGETYDSERGWFEIKDNSFSIQLLGLALGMEDMGTVLEVSYYDANKSSFDISIHSSVSFEQAVSLALEVLSRSPAAVTQEEFFKIYNENSALNPSNEAQMNIKGILYRTENFNNWYSVRASIE